VSIKRSIKVVISLAWYAAHRARNALHPTSTSRSRLTILYYHAVRPEDLSGFRWQVEAIKAYGDVVDADYVGEPDGRPKIAITFDDAFMSMIDNALPELAKNQMTCTIFAPTRCLGSHPKWLVGTTWHDRDEIVADRETLRSVMSIGARIGSHSRSHPNLTQIGLHQAQQEIGGSKADIETLFGSPTDLFAFPYGMYDSRVLRLCEEAGYRFVYSIEERLIDPLDTMMLRPRVAVEPSDTKIEFWLKIRGGYAWLRYASMLKRKVLRAAFQPMITVNN
jgi:peptidoglycan/xylan/chitin deacetylase (PgdA/CDA1 family)